MLNNTKVIPARLIGAKEETGGKVEVLLLKRKQDNVMGNSCKAREKSTSGSKDFFWRWKISWRSHRCC